MQSKLHEKCDKNFPNNFCSISMEKFQPNRHYFWPNIRPKVSANAAEYSVSAETRFFSFGRTLIRTVSRLSDDLKAYKRLNEMAFN